MSRLRQRIFGNRKELDGQARNVYSEFIEERTRRKQIPIQRMDVAPLLWNRLPSDEGYENWYDVLREYIWHFLMKKLSDQTSNTTDKSRYGQLNKRYSQIMDVVAQQRMRTVKEVIDEHGIWLRLYEFAPRADKLAEEGGEIQKEPSRLTDDQIRAEEKEYMEAARRRVQKGFSELLSRKGTGVS